MPDEKHDVQDEELARSTVASLLDQVGNFDDYSLLEGAEVVSLEGRPGVSMTWTQTTFDQGVRTFGLLMTVREMAASLHGSDLPSDLDGWLSDLALAVQEPHVTTAPSDVRTWFQSWP